MARKVTAAIMDVVFVKPFRTAMFGHVCEQFIITKIKRCLVYDPNKVVPIPLKHKSKDNDDG